MIKFQAEKSSIIHTGTKHDSTKSQVALYKFNLTCNEGTVINLSKETKRE